MTVTSEPHGTLGLYWTSPLIGWKSDLLHLHYTWHPEMNLNLHPAGQKFCLLHLDYVRQPGIVFSLYLAAKMYCLLYLDYTSILLLNFIPSTSEPRNQGWCWTPILLVKSHDCYFWFIHSTLGWCWTCNILVKSPSWYNWIWHVTMGCWSKVWPVTSSSHIAGAEPATYLSKVLTVTVGSLLTPSMEKNLDLLVSSPASYIWIIFGTQ